MSPFIYLFIFVGKHGKWSLQTNISANKQMGINTTRGGWTVELHETSGDSIIAPHPKGKKLMDRNYRPPHAQSSLCFFAYISGDSPCLGPLCH
jgi:hypothetical protein